MIKTLSILLLLIPVLAMANGGSWPSPGKTVPAAGGADAQITTYFNCNANTEGQALQKGTGVTQYTGDFTAVAGTVGNGLQDARSGYQFNIPTASNLSFTTGSMAFDWHPTTFGAAGMILDGGDGDNPPLFNLTWLNSTTLRWGYANTGGYQTATVAAGNTYHIEIDWDYANTRKSWRVYNRTTSTWIVGTASTFAEVTGLTGGEPTMPTAMAYGNNSGATNSQWFDQIMWASTYQKDLFSVRDSTNP